MLAEAGILEAIKELELEVCELEVCELEVCEIDGVTVVCNDGV